MRYHQCKRKAGDGKTMESLKKNFSVSLLAAPLTNFVLLISMVGLSIWVFFSLNDLIQTVGSFLILREIASAELGAAAVDSVRIRYMLITVRNFWVLIGGVLLIIFVVGAVDYFSKHWREPRTRRLYLRLLAGELLIVGVSLLLIELTLNAMAILATS